MSKQMTASFAPKAGGFDVIQIDNAFASAEISLLGAHVMKYQPKGEADLLWMSPLSAFEVGKAIRGGIPVCWPWFGKNEQNPDAPMHGLARISLWHLDSIQEQADGTVVKLSFQDSEATRKYFPYSFRLILTVKVGASLELSLKTFNTDTKAFPVSQALHTYFQVGDITKVAVIGFDGKPLFNKVGESSRSVRKGTILVDREIDEVYQDVPGEAVIQDASLARTITIDKENSNSTVVWNPWIAKSQRMADFPDDGYKTMICVETVNAMEDTRTVQPNESLELIACISAK